MAEATKPVHVLRLDRTETKKGVQGPGEGYYWPACSCGWKSDVGVVWDPADSAARLAWEIAFEHARLSSEIF